MNIEIKKRCPLSICWLRCGTAAFEWQFEDQERQSHHTDTTKVTVVTMKIGVSKHRHQSSPGGLAKREGLR